MQLPHMFPSFVRWEEISKRINKIIIKVADLVRHFFFACFEPEECYRVLLTRGADFNVMLSAEAFSFTLFSCLTLNFAF